MLFKKKFRSLILKTINEAYIKKNPKEIICFHRSDDAEHMMRGDFSLEKASGNGLFGSAIYFSESSDISNLLGKHICRFSIILDEPVLDMNMPIDESEQKRLLDLFNEMTNLNVEIDNEIEQIGDFFYEIADQSDWDYNVHFEKFIKKLGYNSFKYFSSYHTDFMNQKGDYGSSYGIYNSKNIKYIDGPL